MTIKCLSMKHETHIIEKLGKETQPGNEIWPVYVILQNNFFIEKLYEKCDLETSPRSFLIFKESSVKNNSKEVSMLIWTDFESFAITYPIYVAYLKNFVFQ